MVWSDSEPFRLASDFRQVLRLQGESLVARLIRYGSYAPPPAGFLTQVQQEVIACLREDASRLSRDALEIIGADGTAASIEIDVRNTQFIAADTAMGCYPNGYEPDILALIDLLVPADGLFIDGGANWGYFSIYLAERPGFRGHIVAFEPGSGPRQDFEAIIRARGLDAVICVRGEALAEAPGSGALNAPIWSGMATIMGDGEGKRVPLIRLDDLDLGEAAFVKLDVEGAEGAAIAGSLGYLDKHSSPLVFECRTDSPGGEWRRPFLLLKTLGYRTYAVSARVDSSSHQDRKIHLLAYPMTADDRSAWPQHLNVLALRRDSAAEARLRAAHVALSAL